MGSDLSREPLKKHGLFKTYEGDNLVLIPLADTKANVMEVPELTLIFLHDNGKCPEDY
jgi:hypothetical protein